MGNALVFSKRFPETVLTRLTVVFSVVMFTFRLSLFFAALRRRQVARRRVEPRSRQ